MALPGASQGLFLVFQIRHYVFGRGILSPSALFSQLGQFHSGMLSNKTAQRKRHRLRSPLPRLRGRGGE